MPPSFEECLDIIKAHEGFSPKVYLCPAGKPTIGYGSTYYHSGKPVMFGDPDITKQEAEEILRGNLIKFWESVDMLTHEKLNGPQLCALTSLAYNIGLDNFAKSTLLKTVNANPNDPAIREQFLRWNKVTSPGLTRRRMAEVEEYFYEQK